MDVHGVITSTGFQVCATLGLQGTEIIGISWFRARRLLSSYLGNNEGPMMGSPQRRLTVDLEVIYATSHGFGDYDDAPVFL